MNYNDKIVFLSRREFPDYEGLRRGYISDPERLVAFRAFTAVLDKMPLEELDRRCVERLQLEQSEREAAAKRNDAMAFFNRPEATANFAVWCALDKWHIDEATALLLGKDPSKVDWGMICDVRFDSIFKDSYRELHDQLLRARKDGKFSDPDTPGKFVDWARTVGREIPPEMGAISAEAAEKPADAVPSRERNSMLTIIVGLAIQHYNYERNRKNIAAKSIADDLEKAGLKRLDEDTIRKYLHQGWDLREQTE